MIYLFQQKFQNLYFILNDCREYHSTPMFVNAASLNFTTGHQIVYHIEILVPRK